MGLFVWLTGCDRAPRYDQRLVQADSLMQPDPDSALAIVEAVNRDSLADEGDRAYRDLLLTQARYRCHITTINDSDINRALNHYRRHSNERGLAKMVIAIARGKKQYDKRQSIKEREDKRTIDRMFKQ